MYMDACCFGVVAQKRWNIDAEFALRSLLLEIEFERVGFIDSAWLRFELKNVARDSVRRKLLSLVPAGRLVVPWNPSISREAEDWVSRLNLEQDASGERDCRHVVCALRGGADFLVTHDRRFFEHLRQRVRILQGLKPVWLLDWKESIHGRR